MITQIQGILVEATPLSAVIDVQGLGYEVHIPVTTAEKLPPSGQKVQLYTRAVYREDNQALYGFATREERDFFRLLTEKVSGVGPKIALSILSKLSPTLLREAIATNDVNLLAKCPGIGKKTAERLVIELRDFIGTIGSGSLTPAEETEAVPTGLSRLGDAVAAMIALGYKAEMADKSIQRALQQLGPDASTQDLIRAALR